MKNRKKRARFLFWFQCLLFALIIARLAELQLIKGEKNRILADENRVRKVTLPAGRGIIYDRLKRPLVENIPLYCLQEEDECRFISRDEALERKSQDEDENLKLKIGRKYLYGESLAHLLGYLGQATKEEVSSFNSRHQLGDLVGRGGVEQEYDYLLKGKNGMEVVETDAHGHRVRVIGQVKPKAGHDLYLSVDARFSQAAFEALEGKPGAVVATNAKTGQVLCLVSSPSFDPNKISSGISAGEYQQLIENQDKPFFNRAISGIYPPGSTFKIITAIAGLQEGEINGQTLIEDRGFIRVGEYVYRNWYFTQYGRTEGKIDVVRAIKRSTDTFFYRVGEKVGASQLADWGRYFGLGQVTGIDLPGEAAGLVPDPEWKQEVKGESWFLGNTYHFAIGQADLVTTPLQVNMVAGVIANGGRLCQPQVSQRDELEKNLSFCQELDIDTQTLGLIKEGMAGACSTDGTAFPLFDLQPAVACKTGTAQFGDSEDRTHAWLTAFAPADEPEIVVTVLLEKGGEGSRDAAPVAKAVLEEWFKDSE